MQEREILKQALKESLKYIDPKTSILLQDPFLYSLYQEILKEEKDVD